MSVDRERELAKVMDEYLIAIFRDLPPANGAMLRMERAVEQLRERVDDHLKDRRRTT